MEESVLYNLLNIISNQNLLDISKKVELEIKGFRTVQIKNGNIIPPRKIIVKELLGKKFKNKVELYFDNKSNQKMILEIDNYEMLNTNEKLKIMEIFEKILSSNIESKIKINGYEVNIDNLKELFLKDNKNNLEIYDNVINKNKNNLVIDTYVEELEIRINELEDEKLNMKKENKQLLLDIKKIKKEKKRLEEENQRIIKNSKMKVDECDKYRNNYINLKKKYDDIKSNIAVQQKEIGIYETKMSELLKQNEELLKQNEELLLKLKGIKRKKVIVIGEITPSMVINIDDYDFTLANGREVEKYFDFSNQWDEVWLLSYDISFIDKINIEKRISADKIIKFSSYKRFKLFLERKRRE